jgi:GNAT superfamily N-acetyltransferase
MVEEQVVPDIGMRASPAAALERISSQYSFVRGRQLEGTYPGDAQTGTWLITAMRVFCGWGAVTEADCPRTMSGKTWPPPEPPGLDAKAKALRTHHYQRVRSAYECCIILGHMLPVNAAFEITDQWFSARNGVIDMPRTVEPIVGSHCVLLIGFDSLQSGFVFVNSWGKRWGNRGLGLLPLEYFDKYLVSAWTARGVGPLPRFYACQGIQTVSWGLLDFLGNSLHGGDLIHGREVYDGTNDERIGWTFAVHREGFLDVEELFVRPQYRGRGHGNQLVEMLLELAAKLKRPLRLWVPFADWTPSNLPAVERIVEKLGLGLFHADVRWAAAMALSPTALPPTHQTEGECHET